MQRQARHRVKPESQIFQLFPAWARDALEPDILDPGHHGASGIAQRQAGGEKPGAAPTGGDFGGSDGGRIAPGAKPANAHGNNRLISAQALPEHQGEKPLQGAIQQGGVEHEAGMIRRGFRQAQSRQCHPGDAIHLHLLQALKCWAVIKAMARGEGQNLGPRHLPCLGQRACRRGRQARQGGQPCAGTKREIILGQARAGFQREAAFAIRREAQFGHAVLGKRNGAENGKITDFQNRRIRMGKRRGGQGGFSHGGGGQHGITKQPVIAKPGHGGGIQPLRPEPRHRATPETQQWMVLRQISQPRTFHRALEPDGSARKRRARQCFTLGHAPKARG